MMTSGKAGRHASAPVTAGLGEHDERRHDKMGAVPQGPMKEHTNVHSH